MDVSETCPGITEEQPCLSYRFTTGFGPEAASLKVVCDNGMNKHMGVISQPGRRGTVHRNASNFANVTDVQAPAVTSNSAPAPHTQL